MLRRTRDVRMRRRTGRQSRCALRDRGVTSVAYAAGAGAGGMVYCVGADAAVCALEPSGGALAARWSAGSHPLACVTASPGARVHGCMENLWAAASGCYVIQITQPAAIICMCSGGTMRGKVYARCMAGSVLVARAVYSALQCDLMQH